MRSAVVLVAALFVAEVHGADDPPKATRVIEGQKTTFPERSPAEGVKATVAVLESCHSISDGTVKCTTDDLKKARKGDHVRLVFARPLGVEVLGKKLEVSEAVYAEGAFLLLCGENLVCCNKYEYDKWDRFLKWYRQTLPAD